MFQNNLKIQNLRYTVEEAQRTTPEGQVLIRVQSMDYGQSIFKNVPAKNLYLSNSEQ